MQLKNKKHSNNTIIYKFVSFSLSQSLFHYFWFRNYSIPKNFPTETNKPTPSFCHVHCRCIEKHTFKQTHTLEKKTQKQHWLIWLWFFRLAFGFSNTFSLISNRFNSRTPPTSQQHHRPVSSSIYPANSFFFKNWMLITSNKKNLTALLSKNSMSFYLLKHDLSVYYPETIH